MGSLTFPAIGSVGVDAQIVIYAVEPHPIYGPLLLPLWAAVQSGTVSVVGSELVLMEVLVGPLKTQDTTRVTAFEQFVIQPGVQLKPITQTILRRAAELRAATRLRTPDAIHAATALILSSTMFLTNDRDFQKVAGLPVTILDDLLKP